MNYIKVASINELKPGKMIKIMLLDTPVLLANLDGTFYAIDDTCPHMGGSLSKGKLEGKNVVCPKHGSVFDIKTGKVIKRGNILLIPVKVHNLKSYPVKIEDQDVMLCIPD
ncbi:non-heme iron oxygenase ferredoxin subunit [Eubacteriaceae bacterium ES2]|nr:non-heme iron oxygenase ferredoxin subunit [Eubacteriaceae bacterium ES2]